MSDLVWTPVQVKLSSLAHWADNPKLLTKAEAKKLEKSSRQLGRAGTLLVGPLNGGGLRPLYDGHQRANIWQGLYGLDTEIWALESNRLLTDEERRAASVMTVTAAGSFDWDKLSGWDARELEGWGMDGDLLKGWNNDANNLKEMLQGEQPHADAEPEIDRAEELRAKWGVELGDLWRIGDHRLICGDCTDAAVVARVMGGELCSLVVIDPPYGVSYADKNIFLNAISPANRIETPIENDHATKEEIQAIWKAAFREMGAVMSPGAVVYCFMPQGGDQMMMMMMMMGAGIEPRHELIWLKNNHVLGRVDYAYKHEPILYAWKDGGHRFYGDFQTSILEFDKPLVSDLHPTMKPVELIQKLVSNSSLPDAILYDGFLGSGTTLVACQNLNRRGRGIEISPAYCAVTLERMSTAFPELTIERVE